MMILTQAAFCLDLKIKLNKLNKIRTPLLISKTLSDHQTTFDKIK